MTGEDRRTTTRLQKDIEVGGSKGIEEKPKEAGGKIRRRGRGEDECRNRRGEGAGVWRKGRERSLAEKRETARGDPIITNIAQNWRGYL